MEGARTDPFGFRQVEAVHYDGLDRGGVETVHDGLELRLTFGQSRVGRLLHAHGGTHDALVVVRG
eukprot:527026-Prorocentrum_minimum.AAC.1